jgi:hypothetical protein
MSRPERILWMTRRNGLDTRRESLLQPIVSLKESRA